MEKKLHIPKIKNGQALGINEIPILLYTDFCAEMLALLKLPKNHCVSYFAYPEEGGFRLLACIANDKNGSIAILSHQINKGAKKELDSLTQHHFPLHIFEREIHENYGIKFSKHPWLKPVRFAQNRADKSLQINDYPFYQINSDELHEVGVGPIHAGIIEPGHFRFLCNGETVLHLEIQLGWQHRGIESLFLKKKKILQQNILVENIAGDMVAGHTIAYALLIESLAGIQTSERLNLERAIALELERIAIHVGDISALCVDVAYNFGASVFSVMRTGIINLIQSWCGNRLGKGLIRAGGTNFQFSPILKANLLVLLDDFEKRFLAMANKAFSLPSVENRFDGIGIVTGKQAQLIGLVGMAARSANVKRDIRETHPFAGFTKNYYETFVLVKGDVYSRFLLRKEEILNSISWLREVLYANSFAETSPELPKYHLKMKPEMFSISLTEGWRGEICHCAITNDKGELAHYKIKDPSMHNWKSLELSLRGLEISDFPINNKSYSLSYCGFDL